ncbi:MAG TPA: hypothetical protein VMW83_15515 [Spirochaetia bacterium]|nr:hypothetical protein [Spirochaetia bacterium]
MTLPVKTDLKSFVTGFLSRSGGLVEETGYALVQALVPDDLVSRLGENLVLTFDYEVARENPEAVFVTYGSQFLDGVARLASEYGRFAAEYCPALSFNQNRRFEREIADKVEFLRCRPPRVVHQRPAQHIFWRFYFLAVFHSFERTEELIPVTMDGFTGLAVPDFDRWWGGVVPVAEPEYEMGRAEGLPLDQVYGAACRQADLAARERASDLQQRATRQLTLELDKVRTYYGQTVRETERKLESAGDPAKKERLAKQLEAVRADWQRREKDCLERYAMAVELKLDHLVACYLPRLHLQVEAQSKDRLFSTTLIYNPLASRIELPVCPLCGKPTTRLTPHVDGRLVCPEHG